MKFRVSAVLMISVNRESEDGWIWKRMAESEDKRRRALPRPLHRGPYPRERSRSGEITHGQWVWPGNGRVMSHVQGIGYEADLFNSDRGTLRHLRYYAAR